MTKDNWSSPWLALLFGEATVWLLNASNFGRVDPPDFMIVSFISENLVPTRTKTKNGRRPGSNLKKERKL